MAGLIGLFSSVFPAECLSPACQWASAHLSLSADPFSRPCDYFLHTCTSDRLSSSSGNSRRRQDIYGHPQSLSGDDDVGPQGSARGSSEEDVLDRKAALLLYLREILGIQLASRLFSPWKSGCISSLCPLCSMISMMVFRVAGELGEGDAEGQKILPDLPGHQVHRLCWSWALPRTRSEGEILSKLIQMRVMLQKSPTTVPIKKLQGKFIHFHSNFLPDLENILSWFSWVEHLKVAYLYQNPHASLLNMPGFTHNPAALWAPSQHLEDAVLSSAGLLCLMRLSLPVCSWGAGPYQASGIRLISTPLSEYWWKITPLFRSSASRWAETLKKLPAGYQKNTSRLVRAEIVKEFHLGSAWFYWLATPLCQ